MVCFLWWTLLGLARIQHNWLDLATFLSSHIKQKCYPSGAVKLFWHWLHEKEVEVSKVAQSCPTLCDPKDCCLPGSSVHGIFQARVLEWVAIPFSRGSSWPRDWTYISYISALAGKFFTTSATWEAQGSLCYVTIIQVDVKVEDRILGG